jgi:6-pyruvoyltetrahydropterin/6-carboxytetrahydropterin synthase
VRLTSRYHFSASHRLHTPALSEEENYALYGKCNNPYGHGHNYVIDITVEGRPDASGQIVNRMTLDNLVKENILARLDHRNLNVDLAEFQSKVPTTENLAAAIQESLERNWTLGAKLVRLRISETDKNSFVWEADR